jgi:hypothetical protein
MSGFVWRTNVNLKNVHAALEIKKKPVRLESSQSQVKTTLFISKEQFPRVHKRIMRYKNIQIIRK